MIKARVSMLVLFATLTVSAQLSVFESPNIANVASEVRDLAGKVTRNAKTDREKVAAIYRWITLNIDYDEIVRSDADVYRSPWYVINSGKAICYGYAQLFRDMCV